MTQEQFEALKAAGFEYEAKQSQSNEIDNIWCEWMVEDVLVAFADALIELKQLKEMGK